MVFAFLCKNYGEAIDHAKITEVVNNVAVLDPQTRNTKPAKASELFMAPQIMKTGADSRSEMVADDQTITRVGADTLFSFEPQERTINLRQGSVLFQSPTGKGGGTIRTASATAAVLGTTIIVVATKDGGFKLLVLEGTGQVRMPDGERRTVHGGQMVYVPAGSHHPGPVVNFRLSEEVKTGRLVYGFNDQLPSWGKIMRQIESQEAQIASGHYRAPGQVIGDPVDPNTRINQIQGLHVLAPAPTPAIPIPTPRPTPVAPVSRESTSIKFHP